MAVPTRQLRTALARVAEGISEVLRLIEAPDEIPDRDGAPPRRRRHRVLDDRPSGPATAPGHDLWRAVDLATASAERTLRRTQALQRLRPYVAREEGARARHRHHGARNGSRDRDEDEDGNGNVAAGLAAALARFRAEGDTNEARRNARTRDED